MGRNEGRERKRERAKAKSTESSLAVHPCQTYFQARRIHANTHSSIPLCLAAEASSVRYRRRCDHYVVYSSGDATSDVTISTCSVVLRLFTSSRPRPWRRPIARADLKKNSVSDKSCRFVAYRNFMRFSACLRERAVDQYLVCYFEWYVANTFGTYAMLNIIYFNIEKRFYS